jgi:hypothetical protein
MVHLIDGGGRPEDGGFRRLLLADPAPNDDELAEIGDRCRVALTRAGMRTGRQLPDRLAVRPMPL